MIARRLVSVSAIVLLFVVWIGLAPVWLVALGLIDLVRGRRRTGTGTGTKEGDEVRAREWVALRCGAMIAIYLTCELGGLVAAGALWLSQKLRPMDEATWLDVHYRLEAAWGSLLLHSITRVFDMHIEVEGEAEARLGDGPYLLLVRHSSIADTLLASSLVSRRHRMRLRYVLKRELLVDPCLDIVGHRLPNAFVDRDSDDSQKEIKRIEDIARGLGRRDGVLIYPEGTRVSPAKRARIEQRFAEKGAKAMTAYLRALPTSVLPPRAGGTLGLLAASHEADVVICTHAGFEGAASVGDIWRGALLHRVVRVHFRRVCRADVPKEPDLQRLWLLDQWMRVGHRVDAQLSKERRQVSHGVRSSPCEA